MYTYTYKKKTHPLRQLEDMRGDALADEELGHGVGAVVAVVGQEVVGVGVELARDLPVVCGLKFVGCVA